MQLKTQKISAALVCCFILAQTEASDTAVEPRIFGWREAVLSVSDLAGWINLWTQAAGYEVVYRGQAGKDWLEVWQLPAGASAEEALLSNPGTESGFLRLVEFSGVPQRHIRSNGHTWETGGWFDVNARVVNLDAKFRQLQALGWQGFADPVSLTFGPFEVNEWLARGPDGVVIALIERVAPPLTGWPTLKNVSRLFNSTLVVADMIASYDFYVNKLGFEVYLETNGPSDTPGPNVLGLPHNLADKISRHVYIVNPVGGNEGSVELIEFDGLTGRDFSEHAHPPNLGVLSLRFPVEHAELLADNLVKKGVTVLSPPRTVNMAPYGEKTLFIVRGPNGEWLEFFE